MRKLTIEEALTELRKRIILDLDRLDSPTWRANNGNLYSYTIGHQDALEEAIVLLETDYDGGVT